MIYRGKEKNILLAGIKKVVLKKELGKVEV